MTEIIIKERRPYPVFAGSMPSRTGGKRTLVLAGVNQDGEWRVQSEDSGREDSTNQPILFVPFGAIDYALTMNDLKEMVAGMRERHERWRDRQPDPPDFTARLKEWAEILKSRLSGKQQFYFKEGIPK